MLSLLTRDSRQSPCGVAAWGSLLGISGCERKLASAATWVQNRGVGSPSTQLGLTDRAGTETPAAPEQATRAEDGESVWAKRQVRLALVMNGGVSLAVWMGGV